MGCAGLWLWMVDGPPGRGHYFHSLFGHAPPGKREAIERHEPNHGHLDLVVRLCLVRGVHHPDAHLFNLGPPMAVGWRSGFARTVYLARRLSGIGACHRKDGGVPVLALRPAPRE